MKGSWMIMESTETNTDLTLLEVFQDGWAKFQSWSLNDPAAAQGYPIDIRPFIYQNALPVATLRRYLLS